MERMRRVWILDSMDSERLCHGSGVRVSGERERDVWVVGVVGRRRRALFR